MSKRPKMTDIFQDEYNLISIEKATDGWYIVCREDGSEKKKREVEIRIRISREGNNYIATGLINPDYDLSIK